MRYLIREIKRYEVFDTKTECIMDRFDEEDKADKYTKELNKEWKRLASLMQMKRDKGGPEGGKIGAG